LTTIDGFGVDDGLQGSATNIKIYKGWKYYISAINDNDFDLTFEMTGATASDLVGKMLLIEG